MQADGWEVDGKTAAQLDTSFRCLYQLGDICMARVEARVRVYDADNGPGQSIIAVAKRFDEDLAQEEREVRIAV
jgi:hypothetical protein